MVRAAARCSWRSKRPEQNPAVLPRKRLELSSNDRVPEELVELSDEHLHAVAMRREEYAAGDLRFPIELSSDALRKQRRRGERRDVR